MGWNYKPIRARMRNAKVCQLYSSDAWLLHPVIRGVHSYQVVSEASFVRANGPASRPDRTCHKKLINEELLQIPNNPRVMRQSLLTVPVWFVNRTNPGRALRCGLTYWIRVLWRVYCSRSSQQAINLIHNHAQSNRLTFGSLCKHPISLTTSVFTFQFSSVIVFLELAGQPKPVHGGGTDVARTTSNGLL